MVSRARREKLKIKNEEMKMREQIDERDRDINDSTWLRSKF